MSKVQKECYLPVWDVYASHVAVINEAQLLASEVSKIKHFDQTHIIKALVYRNT